MDREHEMPEYAIALFDGVWRELARVYWNMNQRRMDERGHDDPGLPGFTVRPYYWGNDDESREASPPNFVFGDVEIRWYKYPGRGMSCNVDWSPAEWVAWFDAATVASRLRWSCGRMTTMDPFETYSDGPARRDLTLEAIAEAAAAVRAIPKVEIDITVAPDVLRALKRRLEEDCLWMTERLVTKADDGDQRTRFTFLPKRALIFSDDRPYPFGPSARADALSVHIDPRLPSGCWHWGAPSP